MTPAALHAPSIVTQPAGQPSWFGEPYLVLVPSTSYSDLVKQQLLGRLRSSVEQASGVEVGESTLSYAERFVSLLPINTPVPDIVLEDDGEIAFDWGVSATSTFSVSVSRDGTLRFAGLFGGKTRYGTDQLTSTIPSEILSYVNAASRV